MGEDRVPPSAKPPVISSEKTEFSPPAVASHAPPDTTKHNFPLLGTRFGGINITEKLKKGGMADVYRGLDIETNTPVILKALKADNYESEEAKKRFMLDAESTSRLKHSHIVETLRHGEHNGIPFIVYRELSGVKDLSDFLKPDSNMIIGVEDCARIALQMAEALMYSHSQGIIHRDFKPSNVLYDSQKGAAILIDFGIAKIANSAIGDVTTTGLIAGTVYYMAPEQLLGRKVTASSDIYALGVIAYELVTGRRPFNPESPAALPDLQRVGVKVLPKHLRPALPTVAQNEMLKALSWLPADRHQSARDFGGALAEALNADDSLNETATNEVAQAISAAKWPATVQSRNNLKKHLPRLTFQKLALAAIAAVGVGVLLVMAFSSWTLNSSNDVAQLTYSLTVQKMRNDKEHESPFQSAGNYIFETGYRFRVNARPHQAGYFYIFNEGPTDEGSFSLTLIYPIPSANGGSARVEAAQPLQTDWNQFAGGTGTEQFWIVWSGSPVSELEMARDDAFKNEKGAVTDPALGRIVREFLLRNSAANLQSKTDTVKEETTINAGGDLLVKLLELKHR